MRVFWSVTESLITHYLQLKQVAEPKGTEKKINEVGEL